MVKIEEKRTKIRAEIEFGRVVLEFGKGFCGLGIVRKKGPPNSKLVPPNSKMGLPNAVIFITEITNKPKTVINPKKCK